MGKPCSVNANCGAARIFGLGFGLTNSNLISHTFVQKDTVIKLISKSLVTTRQFVGLLDVKPGFVSQVRQQNEM